MNNKQGGSGGGPAFVSDAGSGSGSSHLQHTNTPPATLCFPQSPKLTEKQRYRQYHDPYHHHIGLCGCHRVSKSHCVSAFGVLILVLAYTAMGSILFMTLEGDDEMNKTMETAVAASKPRTDLVNADIRSRTVDRLWSITEDLNILYKENWTRLAAQEVQQFQDMLMRAVRASKIQQTGVQPSIKPHKWSYASAFLYSITLITTIGYGGISPRTQWGRIAALLYALFGIPIVLLYLSAMGEGLSIIMRYIFRRIRTCGTGNRSGSCGSSSSSTSNSSSNSSTGIGGTISGRSENGGIMEKPLGSQNYHCTANISTNKHNTKLSKANQKYLNNYNNQSYSYHHNHRHSAGVPISICVMILICYVTMGAALFHRIQSWGVLESLYFCFTSLGTIGFGDLSPKGNVAQYTASAYILIGMAVVAMCFSLIQTELVMWLRKFGVQDQQQAHPTSMVQSLTGPGNGGNSGTAVASYNHLMQHSQHHNHIMHQLPSSTPIEDVALVTVAVTPKS